MNDVSESAPECTALPSYSGLHSAMPFLPAAWRTYSWCRTSSCSGHVVGLVSHVAGLSIHVQGLGLPVAWRSALVIAIITMVLRTDLVCNLAASRFSSALVRKRRGTLYSAPPDLFALSPCHTNRTGPDCDSHELRGKVRVHGLHTYESGACAQPSSSREGRKPQEGRRRALRGSIPASSCSPEFAYLAVELYTARCHLSLSIGHPGRLGGEIYGY